MKRLVSFLNQNYNFIPATTFNSTSSQNERSEEVAAGQKFIVYSIKLFIKLKNANSKRNSNKIKKENK